MQTITIEQYAACRTELLSAKFSIENYSGFYNDGNSEYTTTQKAIIGTTGKLELVTLTEIQGYGQLARHTFERQIQLAEFVSEWEQMEIAEQLSPVLDFARKYPHFIGRTLESARSFTFKSTAQRRLLTGRVSKAIKLAKGTHTHMTQQESSTAPAVNWFVLPAQGFALGFRDWQDGKFSVYVQHIKPDSDLKQQMEARRAELSGA